MKYLENNDYLGVMPATEAVANMIIENLGYEAETETPNLVSVGEDLYGLSPEITVIEDQLCVRLEELPDSIFESVKENPELTEYIEYDEVEYQFEDIITTEDGEVYVTLIEGDVESNEETNEDSDDYVMEVNGVTYNIVDDEANAETFAYLAEDADGEYFLVDSEEEATTVVYMNEA